MSRENDIQVQFDRLTMHRQELAFALNQLAIENRPDVFVALIQTIDDTRNSIAQIKTCLRAWNVEIWDHPDDNESVTFSYMLKNISESAAQPIDQSGWQVSGTVINAQQLVLSSPLSFPPARMNQSRINMIGRVRWYWIDGVLKLSLWNEARIILQLAAGVVRPYQLSLQDPHERPYPLPANTNVLHLYDTCPGILLILGDPGSGKTTLLLELTEQLLDRAMQDAMMPIPVVFNLSAWGPDKPDLSDWLVARLHQDYTVPEALGRDWVANGQILPLLDGLDEVDGKRRHFCVKAINDYQRQHRAALTTKMVVCCRSREYVELPILQQCAAITAQPLSPEQINTYITAGGTALQSVGEVVTKDPTLYELLKTPLFLSLITMAFANKSATVLQSMTSLKARRALVFDAFIQRMFEPRPYGKGDDHVYSRQEILLSLSWLAQQLTTQKTALTFYIESMQPGWLRNDQGAAFVRWNTPMVSCFLSLWIGMTFFKDLSIIAVIVGIGTAIGVLVSLLSEGRIEFVDELVWAPNDVAKSAAVLGGMMGGLIGGLAGIVIIGGIFSATNAVSIGDITFFYVSGVLRGLMLGIPMGIVIGVMIGGTVGGLVGKVPEQRRQPNEGAVRTFLNMIFLSLLFGLVSIFCLRMTFGSTLGLVFGVIMSGVVGLTYGGHALIQHYTLRFVLWWYHVVPWDLARLLDAAARRSFLRRVGGGWIFTHRLLMEYIADLHPSDIRRFL